MLPIARGVFCRLLVFRYRPQGVLTLRTTGLHNPLHQVHAARGPGPESFVARGKVQFMNEYCQYSVGGQRVAHPAELDTCSCGPIWLRAFGPAVLRGCTPLLSTHLVLMRATRSAAKSSTVYTTRHRHTWLKKKRKNH